MIREPCDIILQPGAGASVYGTFQDARKLAGQTGHDITVVGNDVRVVVTPGMDEEQCRHAYTRALREHDREKQTQKPEPQRRAEDTYTSIEDELAAIHKEILSMALLLGAWRARRHDADLRSIAAAANVVALAARQIEKGAEEQAEKP